MNENYWQSLRKKPLPRRRFLALAASAGASAAILACSGDEGEPSPTVESTSGGSGDGEQRSVEAETNDARPTGWTDATHGNETAPDYATVFPKDRVNQIKFVVSSGNWQAMLDDMVDLFGERGTGGGLGGARGGAPGRAAPGGQNVPPQGGPAGGFGGGGPGGGGGFSARNPIWVRANVEFNGLTWTNIGFRFKGNSSLRSSWGQGTHRMPFKLDFDEFEDDHPEIDNQRFYGFKQLSLSNNWNDPSNMREALTYDLLEEAGLVAAETGFYEVLLDYGDGVKNLGLYTFIEVIDDTVVERYFDDPSGNIYEADGSAASFAQGTYDGIEASFQVESDDAQADWSDIEALYDVLHDGLRTSDPDAWRSRLESVFEVDDFLRWLALSTLIQHWDTYGGMTHNFYLYNDPQTGRLNWISWDHNLVLGSGGGGGGFGGGPGGRGNTSFDKSAVSAEWPLISYVLAIPDYEARYHAHLQDLVEGVFEPTRFAAAVSATGELLQSFATQTASASEYEQAVQSLADTAAGRAAEARTYLGQ